MVNFLDTGGGWRSYLSFDTGLANRMGDAVPAKIARLTFTYMFRI